MATCPHAFSLLQNLSLIPSPLGTLPKLFVLASLVTPYHSLTHVCIPVFTFMFSFYTLYTSFAPSQSCSVCSHYMSLAPSF